MADFTLDGQRLAYTVYGEGARTTVLLPGLLLSQKMQAPLARQLAARGNRVVTLDPLGHGDSSRPREHVALLDERRSPSQTIALLDHLELERRSSAAPRWGPTSPSRWPRRRPSASPG